MSAVIYQIRDYHLRRMEQKAAEILRQALDYQQVARDGGPIVEGAAPCDPWAGKHCPGGIDDLGV